MRAYFDLVKIGGAIAYKPINCNNEKTPEIFVANLEPGKIRIYLYQIFTLRESYVIRVYTQM